MPGAVPVSKGLESLVILPIRSFRPRALSGLRPFSFRDGATIRS